MYGRPTNPTISAEHRNCIRAYFASNRTDVKTVPQNPAGASAATNENEVRSSISLFHDGCPPMRAFGILRSITVLWFVTRR
jgi:hypothetical protein